MKKLLFLAVALAGVARAGYCIVGTRQTYGFYKDSHYFLWYDYPNGEHRLARFTTTEPQPFYLGYDFTLGRFCGY